MNFYDFLTDYESKYDIHSLNKRQYWASCVHLSKSNTLTKNTKPMLVEFDVDKKHVTPHGILIIEIYKANYGDRVKTRIASRDNIGNLISIFDTEHEAKVNYNKMLDKLKNDLDSRRRLFNELLDETNADVASQYIK